LFWPHRSSDAHWPPTIESNEVWAVRQQALAIVPGAFIGTALGFPVPLGTDFTIEVTLLKQMGNQHKFGGRATAAGVAIDNKLESAS
jgi:hypothetical protein